MSKIAENDARKIVKIMRKERHAIWWMYIRLRAICFLLRGHAHAVVNECDWADLGSRHPEQTRMLNEINEIYPRIAESFAKEIAKMEHLVADWLAFVSKIQKERV